MLDFSERLDSYWAQELGCLPDDLYGGGVTLCAPKHRDGPRWMGWVIPLASVRLEQAARDVGVISVAPKHLPTLTPLLNDRGVDLLPPPNAGMLPYLRQNFPHGNTRVDRILCCDASSFTPAPEVFPINQLPPTDAQTNWYRLHFDGPVFIVRDDRARIIAWAALKFKSDAIWEMAVVTDIRYRNRGLARSVVSRATQATLAAGRVPMYLHEITNIASSRVCTALGYQPYGYQLSCECGRVMPMTGI